MSRRPLQDCFEASKLLVITWEVPWQHLMLGHIADVI